MLISCWDLTESCSTRIDESVDIKKVDNDAHIHGIWLFKECDILHARGDMDRLKCPTWHKKNPFLFPTDELTWHYRSGTHWSGASSLKVRRIFQANPPINTKPPLHSSFLISMLLSLETWLFEFLIFLAERYDVWKPDKKKYSVSKFCPRSFRIFVRKVVSWVAFTMLLIITHIHDHCRYYELMNKICQ